MESKKLLESSEEQMLLWKARDKGRSSICYGGYCFVVMINGHTCEYRWVQYLSLWNGDNTSRRKQQESTALQFI